jgi:hypothetical protein
MAPTMVLSSSPMCELMCIRDVQNNNAFVMHLEPWPFWKTKVCIMFGNTEGNHELLWRCLLPQTSTSDVSKLVELAFMVLLSMVSLRLSKGSQ